MIGLKNELCNNSQNGFIAQNKYRVSTNVMGFNRGDIMKLKLELELKKAFIRIAKINGELEIKMIAERFAKNYVEEKIISAFKEKGFQGKIITDDKTTIL